MTIQEVGKQILSNSPGKLYVFTGEEYGIKCTYIDKLKEHYSNHLVESESVQEVLLSFSKHQMIKPVPSVYVCRYDMQFVSSLDEKLAKKLLSARIPGTLVLIYEDEKSAKKFQKFLPDVTCSIDKVDSKFVFKYLHADFPALPENLIQAAMKLSTSYGHAKRICEGMSKSNVQALSKLDEVSLFVSLGYKGQATDLQVRYGTASRNFSFLAQVLDDYEGTVDSIFYTMLSTLLELDKIQDKPNTQSDISNLAKGWTRADIYNMYMHVYDSIQQLRNSSQTEPKDLALYTFSWLMFSAIPPLEVPA